MRHASLATLLLSSALLLGPVAHGQTSAVPDTISYQGRVTDSTGTPIGNNSSVNRTAIFRIYDSASGGTRLWSEQQTVTIASGDFSVLLGTGTAVGGEPNANPLHAIFTGAQRFLGVTIDDGTANIDTEISPRQQLVTTAFAFRAKVAESVLSQAISSGMLANNAVTSIQLADTAVTTPKLTDTSVTTAKLADASVTSAKILDGTIGANDIANGQVTAAKLAPDIGVWTPTGSHVYRAAGNVGIGTSTPQAMLSLGNSLANTKLAIYDPNNADVYGLGKGVAQFRFHLGNSAARFSFLNAPSGSEVFTVLGNGNVGVGHTGPETKLHVAGAIAADGASGYTFRGTGDFDGGIFSPGDGQIVFRTNAVERVRINEHGLLGIGHGSPHWPLHVHRADNARAAFTTDTSGSGGSDGLHVGSHASAAFVWNYEATPLQLATSGFARQIIEADGRMGFGMANTDAGVAFQFRAAHTGQVHIMHLRDGNGNEAYSLQHGGNAYKPGGGSWAASSDRRLKTDIQDLRGSLEKLLQLRSVTFYYKDQARQGAGLHHGFIAQEVEPVFPNWVAKNTDGMLMVGPKGFESLAVQAFRELRAEKDAQIATLETRIKDMETRERAQAERLAALEQRFAAFARAAGSADNNN
jgi:hypothetical protein